VLLLANTGGFGLLAKGATCTGRNKGGKAFLTLERRQPLPPVPVAAATARWPAWRWTAGCWCSRWTN
jgi:hypothetical protein